MMYCAIIGDLINSKKIKDRNQVQQNLNELFKEINSSHSYDIKSNLTITLGDEFQVLLKTPKKILKIISRIQDCVYPVEARFGIGFGEITTHIPHNVSIGADGPAYYNARYAINSIRKSEKSKEQPIKKVVLNYSFNKNDKIYKRYDYKYIDTLMNLINSNLSATAFIKGKWSDKQRETITLKEKGFTQKAISENLKITQSNVYRRLEASGYYTYHHCINVSQQHINQMWEFINE